MRAGAWLAGLLGRGPVDVDGMWDVGRWHARRLNRLNDPTGIEATCVWPMEYIKTQLQLQEKLKAGEKPKFTGMIGGACLALTRGMGD